MRNGEDPVLRRRFGTDRDGNQEAEPVIDQIRIENKKKEIEDGEKKGKKYRLLSYHELPDYMKENEFILDYYRADWPVKEALFSIFSWHNETLNVWTHLLGFLLFVGLTVGNLMNVPRVADFITMITVQFLSTAEANSSKNFSMGTTPLFQLNQTSTLITIPSSPETTWPFFVFLAGAMICLLSSSVCHLFSCHSAALNCHLLRVDYVGIALMIIASYFPPIYYMFQCHPFWQFFYLTGISAMGACTIAALLSPALSSQKFRPLRAMLFVSMGMFGFFPMIHFLVLIWGDPQRNVVLGYQLGMAASYLVGAGFYVSRVPERWRPGWFDLVGHSHQIFHVFVVLGSLSHYGAARVFLSYGGKGCGGAFA